jgi:hypothetical protein
MSGRVAPCGLATTNDDAEIKVKGHGVAFNEGARPSTSVARILRRGDGVNAEFRRVPVSLRRLPPLLLLVAGLLQLPAAGWRGAPPS